VYDAEKVYTFILAKIELINSDKYCNRLVRLLLHYLDDKELISNEQLLLIKKKMKNIKEGVDNHVPTDQEVQQTLSQLSPNNQLVYLVYLVSGVRKTEGDYLVKNVGSLKSQQFDGFVKVTMNYLRNTKNSYFCYLPTTTYEQLTNNKQLSVGSLESEIKRKKLIPIKYCRKWFYTKCIELGIPESIADYYQGRSANSVGSNHYLSRQMLADKNYNKIVTYLNSFKL
jgi:intergrase/recombinase